jgi:hypothetical protein
MRGQREPVSEHAPTKDPTRLRWWRIFPGEDYQLRLLREWLRDLLPACLARDDVIAVASELGANAVCHTASGHGGQFSVEVIWAGSMVRVVVGDGGGPGEPRVIDAPDENGRGLQLVQSLATVMGVTGDEHGRFVYAEVPWMADNGPEPREYASAPQTAEDLRTLQGQFPGVPLWFGLSTLQWWALVAFGGSPRLISSASPSTLAAMLAEACASATHRGGDPLPTAGLSSRPRGRVGDEAEPWWPAEPLGMGTA